MSPGPLDEAKLAVAAGRFGEAIRLYQRELMFNPGSGVIRLRLAETYGRRARAERSEIALQYGRREFDAVLAGAPDSPSTLVVLGQVAPWVGRIAEAEAYLRERIRLGDEAAQEPLQRLEEERAQNPGGPLGEGSAFRLPRWAPLAFAGVLVACAAWWWWPAPKAPARYAPVFTLDDLDGRSVSLSQFRGGQVVVLDFWATWCGPCQSSLPIIDRFRARHRGRVEVLSVNLREEPAVIREFIRNHTLDLHVLLDATGAAAQSYQVKGIPTFVVIDRDGVERGRVEGFRSDLDDALERGVQPLLAR